MDLDGACHCPCAASGACIVQFGTLAVLSFELLALHGSSCVAALLVAFSELDVRNAHVASRLMLPLYDSLPGKPWWCRLAGL